MRVLYLAQDLDDAAIWRRVAMVICGGARVTVAGFRRGSGALCPPVEGFAPDKVQCLGQTQNAKLVQRVGMVLRAAFVSLLGRGVDVSIRPDVIVARNLEMLALAMVLRLRLGPVPVCYELLDIHRLMLGHGAMGRVLRALERAMMRRCGLILISSMAFDRNYLTPLQSSKTPVFLVENKPLGFGSARVTAPPDRPASADGGPLVIGWFGILRCNWSLGCLDAVTRAHPGAFRVVLRGKPALDAVPDFHRIVKANPDLHFEGSYSWPTDLPGIYASVDLAWLIDRYDAGLNSDWLLPNRLYEGAGQGSVPIVLQGTEVARRVGQAGFGVVIPKADPESVAQVLRALTRAELHRLRAVLARQPASDWIADSDSCVQLMAALAGAARHGPAHLAATPSKAMT